MWEEAAGGVGGRRSRRQEASGVHNQKQKNPHKNVGKNEVILVVLC